MDATTARPGAPLLLLVRHGEAGLPGPGQGDADRELTPAGRLQVEAVAHLILQAGWAPDAACASPYRRAQATLAGLLEVLAPAGRALPVTAWAGLVPEADPRATAEGLARRLAALGPGGRLLAVGHQPLLGSLAMDLGGASVAVGTADCVALERTASGWSLAGHLRPGLRA